MRKAFFLGFCIVFLFGLTYIGSQQVTLKRRFFTITEPTSSTIWYMCKTYTVKWSNGEKFVITPENNLIKVHLRRHSDKDVNHIIQAERATGECQFHVPCNLAQGDDYFIRITTGPPRKVLGESPDFSVKAQLGPKTYPVMMVEKALTKDDVIIVQCGSNSDCDYCNGIKDINDGCDANDPDTSIAIAGFHHKWDQAFAKDAGDDIYQINLKNGWKFKRIEATWNKSSGEVIGNLSPPFPKGKSDWTPTIHWEVPYNDHLSYTFKIVVEGPNGTDYK